MTQFEVDTIGLGLRRVPVETRHCRQAAVDVIEEERVGQCPGNLLVDQVRSRDVEVVEARERRVAARADRVRYRAVLDRAIAARR